MSTNDRPSTALDSDASETADDLQEAEAAAAKAEARAEAARARAERARQQAKAATSETTEIATASDDTAPPQAAGDAADAAERANKRRRFRLPTRVTVTVAALVLMLCCSLTATGYMGWRHWISARDSRQTAEVATAARENTEILMTLDHATAQADTQGLIDHSTGKFKDHYLAGAKELVADLEKSKVVTRVAVTDVAVESVSADSAVALVAARTEGTNAEGAPQQPRLWRIAMTLSRDGGQLKIADVEFVQ